MRTGSRCTILVKLPVALSGGSSENTEPEAGEKLSTVPSMACSGSASTAIEAGLAGPQAAELGLLEVGVDVDVVERNEAREPLAGLHIIAGLHGAIADHAVDRRADDGERQVALGLGERGLEFGERRDRLLLLALEHVDVGRQPNSIAACAPCTPAIRLIAVRLRLLQQLPARRVACDQQVLSVQLQFGAGRRGLRGDELGPGLDDRGLLRVI